MMATEVNQTYFAWSQGESAERDGSQGISVSQMLDHGSISFGRFELESLSWEKWSVFTHDRRHEEFGKFNGLVAEKKAYFEEYYKKIRELKAAQQQNQQTELTLEYSGDGSDSSQTGEDEPAAELETPTGSGTVVDDSMEQAAAETTSEHQLICYDDHENENLYTELSSSNLSSSAGCLQQANQEVGENVFGDNCADRVDVVQMNVSSSHGDIGTAYKTVRAPRRNIEKDSRLIQASRITPKSLKTPPNNPIAHTVLRKGPGFVKSSTNVNKTKTDYVRSLQRPKAASHKMAGTKDSSNHTAKEALGVTGARRPSSAGARQPSTGERRSISRESAQKITDVPIQRRPSTSERRRPTTKEHGQRQADVAAPRRPSTSERRPVTRETAAKHADAGTLCRPSTGERHRVTRESVMKMDPKTSIKTRATVVYPKCAPTIVGTLNKAVTPNAVKSSKMEAKSYVKEGTNGATLDSHSSRPKRMDLQMSSKQKSSSVNFPPRKKLSSSVVGESGLETNARTKKKEGIQETRKSRASASKNAAPFQSGSVKPPPPPPLPFQASRISSKPNVNNPSTGGRKPKASAPQWH